MRRSGLVYVLALGAILGSVTPISAAAKREAQGDIALASTPPMGWNSWDSYGSSITETEFRRTVQWFHQHLQSYGWQYVVIDEGWYAQRVKDTDSQDLRELVISDDGRYMPAINRFPSASDGRGLKPVADYVHSLGLKFGIHILHGIPREAVEKNLPIAGSAFHLSDAANKEDTCIWNSDNYGVKNNEAGQAYYDSIMRLYADWGVDYLKVDCISSPYNSAEIRMIDTALVKTHRPIVLSLSPGPTPLDKALDVQQHAQLWRISNDMWDLWSKKPDAAGFPQSIRGQFPLLSAWAQYTGPGHWPDADMLPIGYLGPRPGMGPARDARLTHDEEQTMLTLWSIARSPLFLGADLLKMDPFTESLVTDPEIIAVDQHSTGNRPLIQNDDTVVWTAKAPDGAYYVAVFNLADIQRSVVYSWKDLDLPPGAHPVRNLWGRTNIGSMDRLKLTLLPHASAMLRIGKP